MPAASLDRRHPLQAPGVAASGTGALRAFVVEPDWRTAGSRSACGEIA